MQAITLFKCLSEPTRLSIILLVKQYQELCVCHLVDVLGVSQPKVSRHLAQLRECHILQAEKRGQWVYYSLHVDLPDWARAILDVTLKHNKSGQLTDGVLSIPNDRPEC